MPDIDLSLMLHYDGHRAGNVLSRFDKAAHSKDAFHTICHLLPEALAVAQDACIAADVDLKCLLAAQPPLKHYRGGALVALPSEIRIAFEQVITRTETPALRSVTAAAARDASHLIRLLMTMKAAGRLPDIITTWMTRVD